MPFLTSSSQPHVATVLENEAVVNALPMNLRVATVLGQLHCVLEQRRNNLNACCQWHRRLGGLSPRKAVLKRRVEQSRCAQGNRIKMREFLCEP